jgi:tetratricopeptide (TPR) repeat protein
MLPDVLPEALPPIETRIDQLAEEAWNVRNGNSSKATLLATEALGQARSLKYPKGIASSALALAFARFRASNYQEALGLAQEALRIFENLKDLTGQQRTFNILGIVHAESGDLMAALKAFLETHKMCQHTGDIIGEINAFNNLAIVYGYLGDYASALDALLKSLPLIHYRLPRRRDEGAHQYCYFVYPPAQVRGRTRVLAKQPALPQRKRRASSRAGPPQFFQGVHGFRRLRQGPELRL